MKKMVLFSCVLISLLALAVSTNSEAEFQPSVSALPIYRLAYFPTDSDETMLNSQFLKSLNSEITADKAYANSPVNKMGDGVINVSTSWVDVPRQIAQVSAEHNILLGLTLGVGEGVASGVARSASGAFDVATFAAYPYDRPAMKPLYQVDNPNDGFKMSLFKW